MKFVLSFLLTLVLFSCSSKERKPDSEKNVIIQTQDKEILNHVFSLFSEKKEVPIHELMVEVGLFFKGTLYKAKTLEVKPNNEQLIVNLRELDCTTFAENCLAISRTIKSGNPTFEVFIKELQTLRYRGREINGYTSRLHYFSDWIYDNDKKKLLHSVSREIAQIRYRKEINFMSTHPESYVQLKNNSDFVKIISKQEKEISKREMFYIPEEKINLFKSQFKDGDIVGFTTNIEGLDILHVGILVRKSGNIHLLHASTDAEKVILSEETLEEYLKKSSLTTGIMLARPLY